MLVNHRAYLKNLKFSKIVVISPKMSVLVYSELLDIQSAYHRFYYRNIVNIIVVLRVHNSFSNIHQGLWNMLEVPNIDIYHVEFCRKYIYYTSSKN